MKPWARYDRDFVDDEEHVLAMPAKHRAAAYALLLAINGKCYRRPATGRCLRADVDALAAKLGQKSRTLLPILEAVGLVSIEAGHVVLPRFFEWNPELRSELTEKRSEAGKAGAEARWSDGKSHGKPHAISHSKSHAVPHAISMPEIRRERERESSTPLATSSLLAREALAICQAFEARGQGITEEDKRKAAEFAADFQRLSADDFVAEMARTDQERVALGVEPLRRVAGYRTRFRLLNERMNDTGQRPRVTEVRNGSGFVSVGEVAAKVVQ